MITATPQTSIQNAREPLRASTTEAASTNEQQASKNSINYRVNDRGFGPSQAEKSVSNPSQAEKSGFSEKVYETSRGEVIDDNANDDDSDEGSGKIDALSQNLQSDEDATVYPVLKSKDVRQQIYDVISATFA